MNKLHCFIVCVNYSDYLMKTLPWTCGQFDSLHIITTKDDHTTQDVCRLINKDPFITDSFYKDGAPFNKGNAINTALKAVQPDDWVLFMDADIVLPDSFGSKIRAQKLDAQNLYYTERGAVPVHTISADLDALRGDPSLRFDPKHAVRSHGLDCAPWGYFQLVNAACTHLNPNYTWMPVGYTSAEDYDTYFMNKWPMSERIQLPRDEFKVLHLEHGARGANWNGRPSNAQI